VENSSKARFYWKMKKDFKKNSKRFLQEKAKNSQRNRKENGMLTIRKDIEFVIKNSK